MAKEARLKTNVPSFDLSATILRHEVSIPGVISSTRYLFIGTWLYLSTQFFQIPLAAIGPWPIWPRLADVAFLLMLSAWAFTRMPTTNGHSASEALSKGLFYVLYAAAISLFGVGLLLDPGKIAMPLGYQSIPFGSFSLLRLVQIGVTVAIVSRLPLNSYRVSAFRRLFFISLLLALFTIIATYTGAIKTGQFSTWLPSDRSAGPWGNYSRRIGYGIGTVAFNHAYVAAQMLLMTAMAMQLAPRRIVSSENVLLFVGGTGVFLSGSRAGFVSFVVFAIAIIWSRTLGQRILTILVGLLATVVAYLVVGGLPETDSSSDILDRQLTAFQVTDTANLSGRDRIWSTTIDSIIEGNPANWVFGHGLGAAMDLGHAAHSLPLTYFYEFGAVGLSLLGIGFFWLLKSVFEVRSAGTALGWGILALLVGSLTQETFYPNPASGHFLNYFFVSVAITLNVNELQSTRLSEHGKPSMEST